MVRSAQAALLGAVLVVACTRGSSPPGEPLGKFDFTATPLSLGCPFPELQADGGVFDFTASFSAVDGEPTAYIRINDRDRRGTFDGQRFESMYPGPSDAPVTRTFEVAVAGCENRFLIEETLRAVFLTEKQAERQLLSDAGCPDYDSGGPVDLDAGILPPSRGPDGYDATRVCGVLTENIQPAVACDFPACTVTYRVDGKKTE